jgi:hypothetical protein
MGKATAIVSVTTTGEITASNQKIKPFDPLSAAAWL